MFHDPTLTLSGTLIALVASAVGLWLIVRAAHWLYRLVRSQRVVRAVLLGWLLLCLVGEGYGRLRPPARFTPLTTRPDGPIVQLWQAPIPNGLGVLARHYWFAAWHPADGRWHRWEVWQYADWGGTSWDHVHRDLMAADGDVGAGGACPVREWRGREAQLLVAVLNRSSDYPDRNRYLPLPGPNSNTYIRWVVREAGVAIDLEPQALGKDYLGPVGVGITTTGTGLQLETALAGVKVGVGDGLEVHFLCLTVGVDFWTPAIKTPLGRFGFPE